MFEWIISDLDGTLLGHYDDGSIYVNHDAIKLINTFKKYHKVTFATGRHYLNAKNLLKDFGVEFDENDFIIGLNGAQIYSFKEDKIILNQFLNDENINKFKLVIDKLNECYPNEHLVIFYGDNNNIIFINDFTNQDKFNSLMKKLIVYHGEDKDNVFSIKVESDLNQIKHVYKCLIYFEDKCFDFNLYKNLIKKSMHEIEITKSSEHFLEVMKNNVDKRISLEYVNNIYYNVDQTKIIAFGDSLNDLGMFKFANTSVTRNEADEKIKEIATYVINAKASDFVADGIELLVDIEN